MSTRRITISQYHKLMTENKSSLSISCERWARSTMRRRAKLLLTLLEIRQAETLSPGRRTWARPQAQVLAETSRIRIINDVLWGMKLISTSESGPKIAKTRPLRNWICSFSKWYYWQFSFQELRCNHWRNRELSRKEQKFKRTPWTGKHYIVAMILLKKNWLSYYRS